MRVAFDARHAARGLGISTFVVHLATELAVLDGIELIWLGDPAYAPVGITAIARPDRLPYPVLDGPLGRAFVSRLGAEVIHFTGNTGWGRPGPVPSVLTLHDLIFLTTPVRGRNVRQVVGHRYERWLIQRSVRTASVLAVPSQTVAREVTARFGQGTEPRVVYEGVAAPDARDDRISPDYAVDDGSARPLDGFTPYIVAFAGTDPRKRTAAVVDGWRSVAHLGIGLRLLAGAGISDKLRHALEPELHRGAVEILDHLPRRALWAVLTGALALAYPSANEGFGLPVLEAMAAGTPVLSGLAQVTREIGGDAIIALDERDVPGSIAAAVRRLYEDRAYARSVSEAGVARAASFTWRATAEAYRNIYLDAVERHRL